MSGQQLQTMNAIRDANAPFLQGGGSAKAVLYALATFADASGWSYPSLKRLGAAAGLSERATWPIVEKLESAGVLQVVRGTQRRANRYRVSTEALSVLRIASTEAASDLEGPSTEAPSVPTIASTEVASVLTVPSTEAPSVLETPARKLLPASTEAASVEGVQEGKEERERPRPSEIRVIGEESGTKTPIPEDLPLTGDARAYAETIGVRDIDDEWAKFIAHHVKLGDIADTRGWYRGGWVKWSLDAKKFQSERRMRDAKKQAIADADVVRPYHEVAKLAPKPPSKVTAGELAGARELANLFKPKAVGS